MLAGDHNKGLPLPSLHVYKRLMTEVLFFYFFVSHMLPENWTNCLKSRKCDLRFWFTVANHDKRADADEQNHSVLSL